MRIDLYSLRLFRATLDEGSLTRAAEREHIAPSALSKRISDLEQDFGIRLLVRAARGVEATPAGEALGRHARQILGNVAQMERDMADLADGRRGHVRVCATVSAIEGFLSVDLSSFARDNPGISVELQDCLSAAAIEAVRDGEADLGIFSGEPPVTGIENLPYRQQSLVAVLSETHPLAGQATLRMTDIVGYEMVRARSGSALDRQIRDAADALRRQIRYRIRVSGYEGLVEFVRSGTDAIGVAPENCVRTDPGDVVTTRPIDEPWARRRLHLCWGETGAANPSAMRLGQFLAARALDAG